MTEPEAALPSGAWRRIDPAKVRLWAVLVPLHIGAFLVLYFGTLGFLQHAYADAGAEAARQRLDQAVREMPFFAPAASERANPHIFGHLLIAHAPIGLRIYGRTGEPIGARNVSADPDDAARVKEFLVASSRPSEVWVERREGRELVRGLHRMVADQGCTPCHAAGETLGAAAMRIDYTEPLAELRGDLRLRVGALLGTWIVLVGAVSMAVQRSARRSAARLEAELTAAATGRPAGAGRHGPLMLDPVTAEVYDGLRRYLAKQRHREAEVASQLERVDQLASLGQLAAGLAHEIKNPLAGIQGALEVLRDDTPESPVRSIYEEMLAELKRVHQILEQLLTSARPAPVRLAATDVGRLLEDIAGLLRPALRRRQVELRVEVPAGLPAAQLDAAKMRQVLVNLIQNAGEAVDPGGHVVARAGRFPAGGGLILTVEDDGPGIPADARERIFQPFYTTKFSGTGLGLAITRSLIEQHGGRIEVDSEPGRGTTFYVVLPERAAPGAIEAPAGGAAE
ncbi:MAG TPA: ATP-binding protein [Thermoanaerobaculia bacterium]|nr:ATP-binding protein [Thermoanaerobaculia bacterium]